MDISLSEIIARRAGNTRVVALMQHELIDVIIYADKRVANLTAETIMVAQDFGEVYLADKAFAGNPKSETDIAQAYGEILLQLLDTLPTRHATLRHIAQKCVQRHYQSLAQLRLTLERRVSNTIYIPIIVILILLMTILWTLNQ